MSSSQSLRRFTGWGVFLVCLVAVPQSAMGRVYMVVNRQTGALQIVSSSDLAMDAYSVRSPSGQLNPETWNSFTDQGEPNWREANPETVQITELNLTDARQLVGGQFIDIGAPYIGAPSLPSEEELRLEYTTPDGVVLAGNVIYQGQLPSPTITVNRETGTVALTNPGGFDIDGYSISSPSGRLNPGGLAGLPGWLAANPTATSVSELNLEGSASFPNSLDLGSIFDTTRPTPLDSEDLTLEYSTPEGVVATGVVNYEGAVNDLVLQVNQLTGEASIQHLSPNVAPIEVAGYSIVSPSGGLDVDAWTPIADGFTVANPQPSALAELRLAGTTTISNGTSFDMGRILSGEEDLIFQYTTLTETIHGTVQYVFGAGGLSCEQIAMSRIGGDVNGDGSVGFPDFLVLSSNFGQDVAGYEDGDIDCNGNVGFSDFLTLSTNFGQSGAAVSSVPEPSAALLAALTWFPVMAMRRKRRAEIESNPNKGISQ